MRSPTRANNRAWLASLLILTFLGLPLLPGCGGCSKDPDKQAAKDKEKKKKKKKKKPKKPFEISHPRTQPNQPPLVQHSFKPGHWTSVSLEGVSNHVHYPGEWKTSPLQLSDMAYEVSTSRPAVLPKGQRKIFELTFFTPRYLDEDEYLSVDDLDTSRRVQFGARLTPRGGSRTVISTPFPLRTMPEHQFYFFVLSSTPARYAYLQNLPSFHSRRDPDMQGDTRNIEPERVFYQLMRPEFKRRAPLPNNSLTWTPIAYFLWDGMAPDALNADQQQALLDWLHWGGQLIINGPGTLTKLQAQESFLKPYLPAESVGNLSLTEGDLRPLSNHWTQMPAKDGKPQGALLVQSEWPAEQLKLHPDAEMIARAGQGAPLVVERRLGRGRIVLTAFNLGRPEFKFWQEGNDAFLNSCILRRPPREFYFNQNSHVISFNWQINAQERVPENPEIASQLRFFSRDTEPQVNTPGWLVSLQQQPDDPYEDYQMYGPWGGYGEAENFSGGNPVACWDDYNAVSSAARDALVDAAGIKVPDRMFIVKVMAFYLLVLVPVNWAIFRMIGKVEWAWFAAPVITIVATVAVVKLFQLNVGFERAKTEIAVIEVHGDYSRAHLTRYMALYTSLSTRYNLKFDSLNALVHPLADMKQPHEWQTASRINYHVGAESAELTGFDVASNSVGLLHSEEMLDLGGSIVLEKLADGRYRVKNLSRHTLRQPIVLYRNRWVQLGNLAPEASKTFNFPAAGQNDPDPFAYSASEIKAQGLADADETTLRVEHAALKGLNRLRDLAMRSRDREEVLLLAWSDNLIAGISIEPAAAEKRQGNFFIVHLRPAPGTAPAVDRVPFASAQGQVEKVLGVDFSEEAPASAPNP